MSWAGAGFAAFAGWGVLAAYAVSAAEPVELPKLEQVRSLVSATLASERDYRPGDLLRRSQVEAVLRRLEAEGWKVAEGGEILAATLEDGAFLVQALGSKKGRAFMRKVAAQSDGYDRLERLSKLPDGKRIVNRLIKGPDGERLIEYLTASSGGRELGRMLSKTPRGGGFNRPTGRVYTEEQLLQRLEEAHRQEAERRAKEESS